MVPRSHEIPAAWVLQEIGVSVSALVRVLELQKADLLEELEFAVDKGVGRGFSMIMDEVG